MKLGRQQLRLLGALGSPSLFLVVGDKVSESLVRRGLLKGHRVPCEHEYRHGMLQITPDGLRALADAFEAGSVVYNPPGPKPDTKDQP